MKPGKIIQQSQEPQRNSTSETSHASPNRSCGDTGRHVRHAASLGTSPGNDSKSPPTRSPSASWARPALGKSSKAASRFCDITIRLVPEPAKVKKQVAAGNRKYAVNRCDYIHPLYGLHGEVLSEDWPKDHPHHRGIYWAWPEVDWQGKRGDLHALQEVFARPTGKIRAVEGPQFAQIEAENQWCWSGKTPIVREEATLRAWRQTAAGRAIDLEFRFTAIDADVQIARRDGTHYGGLNLRFASLASQKIAPFTDPPGAAARLAWAEREGTSREGRPVALTILQNPRNPDYPGDWVQYPDLSWIQPTFPAPGTRYTIGKGRPLTLRYRLWIHDKPLDLAAIRKLAAEYAAQK